MSTGPTTASSLNRQFNGMLAELDPHSSYLDANSFREMQAQTRGEFDGIGLEVS